MIDENNFCSVCIQVISNPICPRCFLKEARMWLKDKKMSFSKRRIIEKQMRHFISEMEDHFSDTNCIICNSGKVNLCTYCLTAGMKRIIERNASKKIIENFNEDFNNEIWNFV